MLSIIFTEVSQVLTPQGYMTQFFTPHPIGNHKSVEPDDGEPIKPLLRFSGKFVATKRFAPTSRHARAKLWIIRSIIIQDRVGAQDAHLHTYANDRRDAHAPEIMRGSDTA